MRQRILSIVESRYWFFAFLVFFLAVLGIHIWFAIAGGWENISEVLVLTWGNFLNVAAIYVAFRLVGGLLKKILT